MCLIKVAPDSLLAIRRVVQNDLCTLAVIPSIMDEHSEHVILYNGTIHCFYMYKEEEDL